MGFTFAHEDYQMPNKRTHIMIPEDLAAEIDAVVGKRGRSQFLAEAASKELKRLRLLRGVERASGAWQDQDHPELKHGAARWIEKLRQTEEQRLKSRQSQK